VLDESGNFLLVPSLLGIKVINITTNSVSRIIGQPENTERFMAIALWQGLPKKVRMAEWVLLLLLLLPLPLVGGFVCAAWGGMGGKGSHGTCPWCLCM
jgi:hypothetical protein